MEKKLHANCIKWKFFTGLNCTKWKILGSLNCIKWKFFAERSGKRTLLMASFFVVDVVCFGGEVGGSRGYRSRRRHRARKWMFSCTCWRPYSSPWSDVMAASGSMLWSRRYCSISGEHWSGSANSPSESSLAHSLS